MDQKEYQKEYKKEWYEKNKEKIIKDVNHSIANGIISNYYVK